MFRITQFSHRLLIDDSRPGIRGLIIYTCVVGLLYYGIMNKKQEAPHSITLKVMRLAKPSSVGSSCLQTCLFEESDILYGTKGPSQEGLDGSLRLSAAFGEIYLGETFSCYLTVQNCSNEVVSNVIIKAELQATSKRYLLHNLENSPIPSLSPSETEDSVLKRVIRDEGVHILVCTASYLTGNSGRRSFRKFFKFNVAQPFSMSHRQLQCRPAVRKEGVVGDVLIETEIENATPSTLCITSIRMVCNDPLFVLVADDSHPVDETIYIPASCCVQFLHRLRPCRNPETQTFPPSSSTLGYLELSWSRGWGEVGMILSPALYYNVSPKSFIEADFVSMPALIAGTPSSVKCKIVNTHNYEGQTLKVVLVNNPGTAVMLCGNSGYELPVIPPKSHTEIQLTLMPLKAGMHRVGGLVLQGLTEKYVFDNLATCHVDPPAVESPLRKSVVVELFKEQEDDAKVAEFFKEEETQQEQHHQQNLLLEEEEEDTLVDEQKEKVEKNEEQKEQQEENNEEEKEINKGNEEDGIEGKEGEEEEALDERREEERNEEVEEEEEEEEEKEELGEDRKGNSNESKTDGEETK